jgi:SAM-dependent methyltransferase
MLGLNPVKNTFLMEAENIDFNDNSFDIVFCHALLHHIENIDRVLTEMRRVSRKYIIVLEPNRNNPLMFLFSALVKEERKALKFSIKYLRKILSANELEIIESFAFGTTVPNKTPIVMLPILHSLDIRYPFGMTNILITEKV